MVTNNNRKQMVQKLKNDQWDDEQKNFTGLQEFREQDKNVHVK